MLALEILCQVQILAFAMKAFEDFFSVPIWIYRRLGNSAEPFGPPFNRAWKQVWCKRIYYTFLSCYFVIMVSTGFTIMDMMATDGSILDILTAGSCFLFCVNGVLKESFFYYRLKDMYSLADELKAIFPSTKQIQEKMMVSEYCRKTYNLFMSYVLFSNGCGLLWGVLPAFNSTKDYFIHGGKFRRDLCYYISYPWDYEKGSFWLYLLSYYFDLVGGVFATVTFTNIDLIMCAVINQICMNLDYISRSMEEYVPTGNLQEDYDFIFPFIKLHSKCLK